MNRISSISPFIEQRKEKDRANTTVYINYEDYPQWASINNYLITGSRGTGKSSILTSFDYRTRWFNNKSISYSNQFSFFQTKNICETRIIGVLFKADRVETELWDNWHKRSGGNGNLLFATYLNYFFAAKILTSIKEILSRFYPDDKTVLLKTVLIEQLLSVCEPSWRRKFSFLYDFSIEGLVTYFEEQRMNVRQLVYSGMSCDFPLEINILSSSSNFISQFCQILCKEIAPFSDKLFFLMIDDVDRFKDWQIKTLNSFFKVTTTPCAWKISSSLPYQSLATEDDARISGTDLKISSLNDERSMGREQHKDRIDELFDAIFKSRLKSNGINASSIISVKSLFGRMDLEKSLKDVVGLSLNQSLKQEYKDFQNSGERFYTNYWLIKRGILKASDTSKKFDKYRVNATFAIVKAYDLENSFKYSSYEVIRALCSGSPRHFLRICDAMWAAIYDKTKSGTLKRGGIKAEDQNRAIRKASNELLDVIDKDRFNRDITVSCYEMCERLGALFVLLTHNENSLRRSQECMSLTFNMANINNIKRKEVLLKIIDKLTMLEVIKIRVDNNTPSIYQIGLNPMLTPYYCLSFRNPFLNTMSVDVNLLFDYLTGDGTVTPQTLCRERIGYFGPSLFDSINDE